MHNKFLWPRTISTLLLMFSFSEIAGLASSLTIVQTSDGPALAAALGGSGLTVNSATILNGASSQFGTYSNFSGGPVTIGNGIVLSTGLVVESTAAFKSPEDKPNNALDSGTSDVFNTYATGKVANFTSSFDVASLKIEFTLLNPSQIGFDFVFGSIEFPSFTSDYTDAFVAFLDGTDPSNQIVFDGSANPVQVGVSFAEAVTTSDTNTAFAGIHGLVRLQTFSKNILAAGKHTLQFEIGDVNDLELDSAVFISGLRAEAGTGGTTNTGVPEPSTYGLVMLTLIGLATRRRFTAR